MKNRFIKTAIVTICLMAGLNVIAAGTPALKQVIQKYKAGNYTGCLQDAEELTKKDPSNAAAYYYMGSSYMKIGMKGAAKEAFGKVAGLNAAPQLVSLSLQAIHCIDTNEAKCTYMKLSTSQIEELKANPTEFYTNLLSGPKEGSQPAGDPDIDALIEGKYAGNWNISPEARNKIDEMRNNRRPGTVRQEPIRQEQIKQEPAKKETNLKSENTAGKNKAELSNKKPSDKEVANALLTLAKAGYTLNPPENEKVSSDNNERVKESEQKPEKDVTSEILKAYTENLMTEQALMGGFYGNNGNSGMNMLPMLMLMQQQQNNGENSTKNKLSPELVRSMMMSQMQQGLFDFDNNSKF